MRRIGIKLFRCLDGNGLREDSVNYGQVFQIACFSQEVHGIARTYLDEGLDADGIQLRAHVRLKEGEEFQECRGRLEFEDVIIEDLDGIGVNLQNMNLASRVEPKHHRWKRDDMKVILLYCKQIGQQNYCSRPRMSSRRSLYSGAYHR